MWIECSRSLTFLPAGINPQDIFGDSLEIELVVGVVDQVLQAVLLVVNIQHGQGSLLLHRIGTCTSSYSSWVLLTRTSPRLVVVREILLAAILVLWMTCAELSY